MPRIRFVRGVIWNRESRSPGEEVEATDHEARIICDAYKDAVRVDSDAPAASGMTVRDAIETRDPEASHRDPSVAASKRGKK